MAISIDWGTRIIYIPQSYLSDLGGGKYGLDVDQFRLDLKDVEDSVEGMPFPDTHRHSTEVTLSGVTYTRFVEIINGYTVELENGNYTVICSGANHNLADVKIANSVSMIIGNSAGLITVASGSGVTEQDKQDIAGLVEVQTGQPIKVTVQSTSETLDDVDFNMQRLLPQITFLEDIQAGRWRIIDNQMIFYKADNVTEIVRFNLLDAAGQPATTDVFERVRA